MNREIEFRGIDEKTKEWVYGYYVKGSAIHRIYRSLALYPSYDVIPETIGQYTGLKDKNGKKIFEGDKVKAKFYNTDVEGEIGFANGCFLLFNSCVSDNQLFIFSDIEVIGNIYEGGDIK